MIRNGDKEEKMYLKKARHSTKRFTVGTRDQILKRALKLRRGGDLNHPAAA